MSGAIALALMIWGSRVDRQCIGYDAGRPFWPCETPNFVLGSLNVPPVAVAQLLSRTWSTAPIHFNYAVEFPLILWWWWFVGTRLDFGLLGVSQYKRRGAWITLTSGAIVVLLGLIGWSLWEEVVFHRTFASAADPGFLRVLGDLRSLPVYLWTVAIVTALGVASFRIFRGQSGQTDKRIASPVTMRYATAGFAAYCLCVAATCWHLKNVEEREQAEYDRQSIIVKGKVIDERGQPISAVEVDLVPELKDSDAQSNQTIKDWTDKNGEYTLRPEAAGRFFLSVLWEAPPSTKHPFMTRYYPDATDQTHAQIFDITPARHLDLGPMRLQTLHLSKVQATVSWSNGKPEPDAYLFFKNKLFPQHGSIGDETLHIGDDGTVSLPAGFDYSANAQVDCDGGQVIANAYTPELNVSTKPGTAPSGPLHFVLPGDPCKVWHGR